MKDECCLVHCAAGKFKLPHFNLFGIKKIAHGISTISVSRSATIVLTYLMKVISYENIKKNMTLNTFHSIIKIHLKTRFTILSINVLKSILMKAFYSNYCTMQMH